MTMKKCLGPLCFLGSLLHTLIQCTTGSATEFQLKGDYLMGGLFDIHHAIRPIPHGRPEFTDCSGKPFILSSYRRFQLMRFAVEEINNSTSLLPNISLGYEIFDHCSDAQNFPGILKLISVNDLIQPWGDQYSNVSRLIAVIGAYTSTDTRTVAPFFMMNTIPMVSYGSQSSIFSRKQNFPSFLRTVHPNKDVIQVIVNILLHFNWRWVAFLNMDDDYGNDGLTVFIKMIKNTEICLAYTKGLTNFTDYTLVFNQIDELRIPIIIVYVPEWTAEALIQYAIKLNISEKVWIASDAWSLNEKLPKKEGIRSIGTVLGVAEPRLTIPGFNDFVNASRSQEHVDQENFFCNQVFNGSGVTANDVISVDPSFSFSVYSAVYAIAHALHRVLQCGSDSCNNNITVYPYKVLAELKKSNFTILKQRIAFDENGDPQYGQYLIVYWNHSGEAEKVGFYKFQPSSHLYIDRSKIQWHKNEVPISVCSRECREGYKRKYDGVHKCCFACEKCPKGTFVNSTADLYRCYNCKETEWSAEGSTSCSLREVVYVPFTDTGAILVMVGAVVFVALTLAMSVLFAINYNTPVVRSAGGPMCFLILGCLSLSSLSVFFYFGKPTVPICILRFLPFLLFYTVSLACFAVRSFQIVYIFKIATKFQNLNQWWRKYHIQWLIIAVTSITQTLLLVFAYSYHRHMLHKNTDWYPDKIILVCELHLEDFSGSLVLLLLLCFLSFIFSYMGKNFPNNYNEAKSITFCLLLLILTWIIFATVFILYRGKYIHILNALAVLSSLYSFLLYYFLPKCYIIIFQSHKNTQQYFQGLIHNYTKAISQ